MIGPNRDTYVARCGQPFPTRAEGAAHEKHCRDCLWDYQLERADMERDDRRKDGTKLP